jgi:hypothetical protein
MEKREGTTRYRGKETGSWWRYKDKTREMKQNGKRRGEEGKD